MPSARTSSACWAISSWTIADRALAVCATLISPRVPRSDIHVSTARHAPAAMMNSPSSGWISTAART
ncbi:hypothetical protein QP175_15445 [Sphingomonas aerolata]